jgi:hypothetical protein
MEKRTINSVKSANICKELADMLQRIIRKKAKIKEAAATGDFYFFY